jgi:hypothetical protein
MSKKIFWPKANDVNILGYYTWENSVTYINIYYCSDCKIRDVIFIG